MVMHPWWKELDDELAMLDGLPPYDGSSNPCCHDAYYGKSLEQKYGLPVRLLRRIVEKRKTEGGR